MNIFFLSRDPAKCARYHANKHVVKMILESAQLLSTCWHVVDASHVHFVPRMKKTHVNHPCAKWVREGVGNYLWLCNLALNLCKEYTFRYGKTHKTEGYIRELANVRPPLDKTGMTQPPQAMPNEYKVANQVVTAYRNYYVHGKSHLHAWKDREVPSFVLKGTQ